MAATDRDIDGAGRRRRRLEIGAFSCWLLVVALFFLWQAIRYNGFMARAAEWQFDLFGRYFPAFTLLIMIAVFGSPILAYMLYRRRQAKAELVLDARNGGRAIAAATRLMRGLFYISAGFSASSGIAFLLTYTLPDDGGTTQQVVLGSLSALSPAEGRSALVGDVLYKRTSAFGQNLLVTRRYTYFAPVAPRGRADTRFRYFVELRQLPGEQLKFAPIASGILRRNALPGEIIQLYRNVGYRVQRPHYVLFVSGESMRWPYYVVAAELAAGALLFLLFGVIQRWRRDRLRRAASVAAV